MATDTEQIVANLVAFYDWTDRTVVDVGAGGGQLVEFARAARRVIAIDPDPAAMERLAMRARERGLSEKLTLVTDDLLAARPTGDVVLFEFCLHQMPDPKRALRHARGLAPDVVVIDHAATSRWSWFAAEDAKVQAAWKAVESQTIRHHQTVEAWQRFRDFAELASRLAGQGPTSAERIEALRDQTDITIPMPYRLALL